MSGKDGLTREDLKQAVCEAIDRQGELGDRVLHHPETGFNEAETSALVIERLVMDAPGRGTK